jgi:peptidoglycan/LPS O-acetylase OafA/YrhL
VQAQLKETGRIAAAVETARADYRPEIDGLRAIAVVAVILNHFDARLLPGGFLGVDVFFVISGFVITSSLAGLPRENFARFFGRFLARRARRLLPALALCVLVTGVLICRVDPAPQVSLQTGIFALFGLSNLFLWSTSSDYFARAAEANPFTQTWSLGVEEQYYLLYPAVVWLAGYPRQATGWRRLAWTIAVLSAMSLGGLLLLERADSAAAFYLMPTRFWELGAGCLLFLLLSRSGRRHVRLLTRHAPMAGAASLVALLLFLPGRFSALAAVPIVAVTLLLIATSAPGTTVHACLTSPAFQYIGRLSYSLYLWHWSVLVLSRWAVGSHLVLTPVLLIVMVGLAAASYHLVERPLRHATWPATSMRTIALGSALGAAVAGALWTLVQQHGLLLREHQATFTRPPAFVPLKKGRRPFNPTCVVNGLTDSLDPRTFDDCTVRPAKGSGQTIWTLGDSHAGHLQGLLYSLHDRTGVGVHLIETPGIAFPLNVPRSEPRQQIFNQVMSRARPGDIVLVSRLFLERSNQRPRADVEGWSAKLAPLAWRLRNHGLKLVVFGPPPMFAYEDVESCHFSILGFSPCAKERFAIASSVHEVLGTLERSLRGYDNAFVFDSFDPLCPGSTLTCSPIREDTFLFRDKDHLNSYGAASLADPFIEFLSRNRLLIEADPPAAADGAPHADRQS